MGFGGYHRVKLGFLRKQNLNKNYKYLFTTFGKILAPYEHFCVTYAIFHFSPFFQNFDQIITNISRMRIDTDMRFFAKVPQCN